MANTLSHKEQTRQRILNEAAKALRLTGTNGASVAQLMKRAGLTHGGFYAHFASKNELVALAVDRMFEDTAWMVSRFLSGAQTRAGLLDLIDFYLSEEAYLKRDRGCPLPALSGEAHRMPAAARDRIERGIREFRDAIAGALAKMGQKDCEVLATSILAELAGAMILARSFSKKETALEILATSRKALRARISSCDDISGC